jgi:uncharacterized protein (TIGR00369 family)
MELSDDEIRATLRDPAKHPPSARHLGFELIDFSVENGWAEVAFTPRPEFANPAGSVQGGFVCAMLDDAMSVAASISRRFAVIVPTLQITVTYLRRHHSRTSWYAAKCCALVHRAWRCRGALRDADGTILAVAVATAVPRPFPR